MISSYKFGTFTISGKKYDSNIYLFNEDVKPAPYLPNHELKLDHILPLIESKPEIIIIGTGYSGVIEVAKEIIDAVRSAGIKLMIENSRDAVRSYNSLLGEKNVAAFLHNTC